MSEPKIVRLNETNKGVSDMPKNIDPFILPFLSAFKAKGLSGIFRKQQNKKGKTK